MTIVTKYDRKPIPDHRFDWSAWIKGEEEFGCAYGPTEKAAIEALYDLIEESREES